MTLAGEQWGYDVEERPIAVDELGTFREVAGCGTAVVMMGVKSLTRGDKAAGTEQARRRPSAERGASASRGEEAQAPLPPQVWKYSEGLEHVGQMYAKYRAIQFGEAEDVYGWGTEALAGARARADARAAAAAAAAAVGLARARAARRVARATAKLTRPVPPSLKVPSHEHVALSGASAGASARRPAAPRPPAPRAPRRAPRGAARSMRGGRRNARARASRAGAVSPAVIAGERRAGRPPPPPPPPRDLRRGASGRRARRRGACRDNSALKHTRATHTHARARTAGRGAALFPTTRRAPPSARAGAAAGGSRPPPRARRRRGSGSRASAAVAVRAREAERAVERAVGVRSSALLLERRAFSSCSHRKSWSTTFSGTSRRPGSASFRSHARVRVALEEGLDRARRCACGSCASRRRA